MGNDDGRGSEVRSDVTTNMRKVNVPSSTVHSMERGSHNLLDY